MYEKVNVKRCLKCLGYNHKSENCTGDKACLKCGENDHEIKDCKSENSKCINCYNAKLKTKFDQIDINHDVRSLDCPIYRRKLMSERSKINY